MNREEIENAGRIEREKIINELQDGYNNHHHDINLYTVASATIGQYALPLFIAGANWRINKMWHDASEKPKQGCMTLVVCSNGTSYVCGPNYSDWNDAVRVFLIERWAYIEDLLPEEE